MAFAGLAGLLLWSRTRGLGHGFWNDEAFTVLEFIEKGPREIFVGAEVPAVHSLNNHRLFSLLAWATTEMLGRSELVYRLWAVVPGVLAAVGITAWVLRRIGAWESVVVAWLVTTSPLHAELATQARGYSLGILAGAMILAGSVAMADHETGRRGAAVFGVGGWFGVWTLPVFALPFVAQGVPLLIDRRSRRAAVAIVLAVGVVSLAFYLPVLSLIAEAGHQDFGPLVTWRTIVLGPPGDFLQPSLELVSGRPEWLLACVVYLATTALAVVALWRRGDRMLLLLLVAPVAGTYGALALLGAHAVPRYVSYLLLHAFVLSAIGVVEGIRLLGRLRVLQAAAVAGLVLGASLGLGGFVRAERERAAIPIEGYRDALEIARRAGLPIVTNTYFGAGFGYYGRDLHVRHPDVGTLEVMFCDRSESFVYVHYPLYGNRVDLRCLYARSPEVHSIPQVAGGPGGWMTVFVVTR